MERSDEGNRPDRYGSPDVLELANVEELVVGDADVLVRIRAASLNQGDLDYLYGRPSLTRMGTGPRTPRYRGLGFDVAGQVEAVGNEVPGSSRATRSSRTRPSSVRGPSPSRRSLRMARAGASSLSKLPADQYPDLAEHVMQHRSGFSDPPPSKGRSSPATDGQQRRSLAEAPGLVRDDWVVAAHLSRPRHGFVETSALPAWRRSAKGDRRDPHTRRERTASAMTTSSRLAQQWVVEQVDLPDRQEIRGPPVGVDEISLLVGQRAGVVSPRWVAWSAALSRIPSVRRVRGEQQRIAREAQQERCAHGPNGQSRSWPSPTWVCRLGHGARAADGM